LFVFHCIHIVYKPIVNTISHLQGHSAALYSTSLHVHLLNSLKSQLSLNDGTPHDAKTTYQAMITSASQTADATAVTAAPRNVEQIRNTQKTQRSASRLSCDALYNWHEFAYNSNFIHRFVTYPILSLICYNPSIVELFPSLLSSVADSDKPTVSMTYDKPPSISVTFTSQFCSSGKQISSQSNSAACLRCFGYYFSISLKKLRSLHVRKRSPNTCV